MMQGADPPARERKAARARVSGALGLSVVLHVLGAVALWRGVSEPESEHLESGEPLEVELVWREVPAVIRVSESPARPASPSRRPKVGTPRSEVSPEVSGPAPAQGGPPPEPELPGRESETPSGGSGDDVASKAPGEVVETGPEGAGPSGASGGGAPGGGGGASELVLYREHLRQRVKGRLRYPAQAVRLGMVGTALVRVRINRDGSLAAPPRLEGSSRFRVLDVEALRTVEAAAPFAPLPLEIPRDPVEFIIPVSFSLRVAPG